MNAPRTDPKQPQTIQSATIADHLLRLRDLWHDQTTADDIHLVVWRIREDSQSILEAFLALQQGDSEVSTPDVFLRYIEPFETGYAYSLALQRHLVDMYQRSESRLDAMARLGGWKPTALTASAAGCMNTMASFVAHCKLDGIALVLTPHPGGADGAFADWLNQALEHLGRQTQTSPKIRLVLIESFEKPLWASLVQQYSPHARVLEYPGSIWDVMNEVAQEQGARGALGRQQRTTAEMMKLLAANDAPAAQRLVDARLPDVEAQGWHGQAYVLQFMAAGAWLAQRDTARAIQGYRQARESANKAQAAGDPTAATLRMQSWFGEASAWLAANDKVEAATAYVQAAEAAKAVPHLLYQVEGLRSASRCMFDHGKREHAQTLALQAVEVAREIPDTERPYTTAAQLLQDLLHMQDPRAAQRLLDLADRYQASIASAQKQAQQDATRLGQMPAQESVDRIDAQMTRRYEEAFAIFVREREGVIDRAAKPFQAVVALGRAWFGLGWNGLPQVAHPLEKEAPQWVEAPTYCVQPDARALEGWS